MIGTNNRNEDTKEDEHGMKVPTLITQKEDDSGIGE